MYQEEGIFFESSFLCYGVDSLVTNMFPPGEQGR